MMWLFHLQATLPRRDPVPDGTIDMEHICIGNNVPLQAETIPEPLLNSVDLFFACLRCGKVFWEGKHFASVCEQFDHILNRDDQVRADHAYKKAQQERQLLEPDLGIQ